MASLLKCAESQSSGCNETQVVDPTNESPPAAAAVATLLVRHSNRQPSYAGIKHLESDITHTSVAYNPLKGADA